MAARQSRQTPSCPHCRAVIAAAPEHLQVNRVLLDALAELRTLRGSSRAAPAAAAVRDDSASYTLHADDIVVGDIIGSLRSSTTVRGRVRPSR